MARLIIVEQSALNTGGHYYSYTRCLGEAAKQQGLDLVILQNRRFSGTWDIDGASVINAFSLTWGEAENLARRSWGVGNLAFEFVQATRNLGLGPGDHVLFHTLGFAELIALLDYLSSAADPAGLPSMHILLRYDPNYMRDDLRTFRPLFDRIAASAALRRALRFHADTELLSSAFARLSLLPFTTLPIPFDQTHMRARLAAHQRSPAAPLVLAYLGDARLEKGYGFLPDAIAELRSSQGGTRSHRFVLQSNFNSPGGEAGMMAARDALRSMADVEVLDEALDSASYYARLVAADVILIPYDPARYGARSSGILIEAMAAGKPVVTTAGTWMETQVSRDHAIVYGPDRSLGSAMAELVATYDTLAAGAQAIGADWRANATGEHFVRKLIASAAPVEPASPGPRVLLVMNGDAMLLRNGASRVALSQLGYLRDAGYRVCLVFVGYDAEALAGSLDQWVADVSDRVRGFDLEAIFAATLSREANARWRHEPGGPTMQGDFDMHRWFDFGPELAAYLAGHAIDAVLINYITCFPVVETLGLAHLPVICELHDLQSAQKALYGSRELSQDDLDAEFAMLARCSHLIALNPDEASLMAKQLARPPVSVTGVFPEPVPAAVQSLAGCLDLVELMASCRPAVDLARVREVLGAADGIDMLFVGSNHWPNLNGLTWFLNEVFLPHLAPLGKTLVVAGSVTDYGEWPASPHIVYLGRVGELAPLYAATRVVLLPIFEGAGSPVKTVEALLAGSPVVATPFAMRGIDEALWKGVAVESEPDRFRDAVLALLDDPVRRRTVGRQVRGMGRTLCDPARYIAVMNGVFRQVLGERAPQSDATPTHGAAADDAVFEWSGTIGAVNTLLRGSLANAPLDVASLDLLRDAPDAEVRELIEAVVEAFVTQQRAPILKARPDLLQQVVYGDPARQVDAVERAIRAHRSQEAAT